MTVLTDEMRKEIRHQLVGSAPRKGKRTRIPRDGNYFALPRASEALGVSPDQIPEATEHLRKSGIFADFDKKGRCLVTSHQQATDIATACGMRSGRDGYAVKDHDGHEKLTGRQQHLERERLKRQIFSYDDR